jgi:DnaJ-domain-containing protein 1
LICSYAKYNNTSWTKDKVVFVKSLFESECETQKDTDILCELLKEEPHNIYPLIKTILEKEPTYRYKFKLFESCAEIFNYNEFPDNTIINVLTYLGKLLGINETVYKNIINSYLKDYGSENSNEENSYQKSSSNLDKAYILLEINKFATKSELMTAYRKKMMQYHPDRNPNVTEEVRNLLNQKTHEINEARDLIMENSN